MKIGFCALLIIIMAACGDVKKETIVSMPGAYTMLSQSFKGNVIDTTFTQLKQCKIYTPDYMMYVRVNPADSMSAFGIGTFKFDSGRVIDNIMYSAVDTAESIGVLTDTFNVTITGKNYTLTIPQLRSDKGNISLTEEYQSVGTDSTSPLDGVWKQVSGYTVTKKDTVHWADVQYKAFYAGCFAFGNVYKTSGNKKHTGISYGTFTMAGSRVKETITNSTWSALQGQSFEVDIAMNGNDAFTQTIIERNGDKEVLQYQRLRKY